MLRIIAGKFKRRQLRIPSKGIRPTNDRVKESLFNILTHHPDLPPLENAKVLELFCGSGALGFEALSRGAATGTFVDNHTTSLKCCQENAQALQVTEISTFIKGDATTFFQPNVSYDWIFMDPPYHQGLADKALENLKRKNLLHINTALFIETAAQEQLLSLSSFQLVKEVICGPAHLWFLKAL